MSAREVARSAIGALAPAPDAARRRAIATAREALDDRLRSRAGAWLRRAALGRQRRPAGREHDSPFTLVVRRAGALRRALLPPSELALVEAYLRDDLDAEGDLGAAGRLGDLAATRLRSPRALLEARARVARGCPRMTCPTRPARRTRRPAASCAALFGIGRHSRGATRSPSATTTTSATTSTRSGSIADRSTRARTSPPAGKISTRRRRRSSSTSAASCASSPASGCSTSAAGGAGCSSTRRRATVYPASGSRSASRRQLLARERLAAAGVGERVRIEVRDYRDLPTEWRFDKAVSVGMREHVGAARLPEYFAAVHRALRPGGLFLDHGLMRGGAEEQSGVGAGSRAVSGSATRSSSATSFPTASSCRSARCSTWPSATRARGARRGEPARALHPHAAPLGGSARVARTRRPRRSSASIRTACGGSTWPPPRSASRAAGSR